VTLPATVTADAAVTVKATVDDLFVAAGASVTAGAPLSDIRVETVPAPIEKTDVDGLVTITQPKTVVRFVTVSALAVGTLSALSVIHGQSAAIGDVTGQIAPPTFSVSGSLSPEQQYRLLSRPADASVAIDGGPAPFTCTGLSITTPLAGAGGGDSSGGGAGPAPGASGTTVSCAVPPEVTVYSGLAAEITIAAGLAENVLVVPTTAVQGTAGSGTVWVNTGGGTPGGLSRETGPQTAGGVDVPYGTMHRVEMNAGTWFSNADAERLAPAVLVNSIFYDRIGRPDLASHPTATLLGDRDTTAVITGVFPAQGWEQTPAMYLLADSLAALAAPVGLPQSDALPNAEPSANSSGPPTYELWVPPELADPIIFALQRDVSDALGEGADAQVYRTDYASWNNGEDPYLPLKLMVGGVAGLVLLLGALGLVNIALVTLKQRIREIGIRRSFGATAGRVFFSVMMESVVATVVAGVVRVIAAVLIVKNPMVEGVISQGQVTDHPAFAVEAALIGLVSATAVGALAGLVPASSPCVSR